MITANEIEDFKSSWQTKSRLKNYFQPAFNLLVSLALRSQARYGIHFRGHRPSPSLGVLINPFLSLYETF